MKTITGTYFNGQLTLKKPLKTKRPIKVTLTIEDELELKRTSSKKILKISDFSFTEAQALLKDYKGSFSDEVINERRKAL